MEAVVLRSAALIRDVSLGSWKLVRVMVRVRWRCSTWKWIEVGGKLILREELGRSLVWAERGHVKLMGLLGVEHHLLISPLSELSVGSGVKIRVLLRYGILGGVKWVLLLLQRVLIKGRVEGLGRY
jgi:hypothetical protein